MALAPLFESVRAVEINRTLAQAAEDNLTANNITNAKIFRMSSESIDESIFAGCDVILVDPPRAGLDATARQCVAKFDQILYISCNPLALKGDIKSLGEGFEVVALAIFDMFPYTTHAECAVRIRRRRQAFVPRSPSSRRWKFLVLFVIGAVAAALYRRRFRCKLAA